MMVFLLATTGLYAQQAGLWTFGIRGGVAPGMHSIDESAIRSSVQRWWDTPGGWSSDTAIGSLGSVSIGGINHHRGSNIALYVAYTFMNNLSIRLR